MLETYNVTVRPEHDAADTFAVEAERPGLAQTLAMNEYLREHPEFKSGQHVGFDTEKKRDPSNALDPNVVYFGDNGRAICLDCAGYAARKTGLDLSGQPVQKATAADIAAWPADLGPLTCECGKVTA